MGDEEAGRMHLTDEILTLHARDGVLACIQKAKC
jgi:hypothetical protein